MADIFGTMLGIGANMAVGGFNNWLSGQRTDYDREQSYRYGEMFAENADRRTRALYNDFYSPQALMQQYKEAGLSPSMMFGGTPGQGGTPGAQGGGMQMQTPYMPISMLEGAQIANINAQTEKTKAETKNIEKDTDIKRLEEQYNAWRNQERNIEYSLTNLWVSDTDTGEKTSFYEIANNCNSYEEFTEEARKLLKKGGLEQELQQTGTEAGQRVLRTIWMTANWYETEITELSSKNTSAKFQENLIKCLSTEGFEKQNAETIMKQLKAAGESADLTKEQKGAWNRVLERIRKKNSTAADYIIVAAMIVNQAMSNYHLPGVNITNQYRSSNTTINDMR